jgi:hypothetical protein
MPFDRAILGIGDFHNQLWEKWFALFNFWDGTLSVLKLWLNGLWWHVV